MQNNKTITLDKETVDILVNIFTYCIMEFVISFTKYLGTAFVALAGVIFSIGFQLHFQWNQPCDAILIWILAGIIFFLGMGSFTICGILSYRKEHPPKHYIGFNEINSDKDNNGFK
jgi:hypothetical protein